ncbi:MULTISPECIES: pseudaminic acid biosynthesis-associated methylase [Thalassospira]|uniref:Methyltransferase domain-containing protein n=1 Tax=Thalassospira povalilytica TaxID=732237 RepID=A0A8I1M690_9PROT|nr:pseudaminic acid biosynthesis-associated methylase [Thalassospira povalilytica]MBN8195903.1 methyltransferase domain-containing protein [Thalassospira povalilytica]PKR52351.1 methyltransferase type 11 [Thalassospira povalilytica]
MTTGARKNEQQEFWRGEFGTDYINRNSASSAELRARLTLWSRILDCIKGEEPTGILEVGSNIGNNLRALRLLSGAQIFALEPNSEARKILVEDNVLPQENVFEGVADMLPFEDSSIDLVFTSGVLIHIHPNDLERSMREIHRVSGKYIVCIEYFSDKPEAIPYRGHTDKLFKRDFGGYYMDLFPELKLIDYGFSWKRASGLDNLTWWVFKK